MIGTTELRALAATARTYGDAEFADLADTLAARREHDYDERHLAPLVHALHPQAPEDGTFASLPPLVRERLTELATAIRVRLEEHGWARPAEPGRRWKYAASIPEGVRFRPIGDHENQWVRADRYALPAPTVGEAEVADAAFIAATLDDEYSDGYIEVLA
ncbi:hypothetical protein NDR87_26180 [Nocardia sp. CDC159]|uniref:Uncharacterized protein n=1 Tax=Nocardia pulmonis TaxID=2951408 RepID=A0A9X2E7A6_9NOCA|nr:MULTISPECIES: hypothetical protein [Nocardia]MCM6774935.1 hypothetical protein [Nocardia pulmonis]MCM6789866.1 hypothetical protein [Nocardia sp. CDC159]